MVSRDTRAAARTGRGSASRPSASPVPSPASPPAPPVRTPLWWPLLTLAAVAAAAAGAAEYTPVDWRRIVTGAAAGAAVLLFCWVLLLARLLRRQRMRYAAGRRTDEARAAEVAHLASVRVPAIAERRREGRGLDDVPGPLSPAADTGEEFAAALDLIVAALGSDEAVRRERALRDAVQAAFESVARHMHAMATVQQQVLDEVEQNIEDPELMSGVMKADHAAAQMTRKAQTLLVMCGVWPARRENRPVSLYDCVRGAQSRIVEFARVEVHGGQSLYVVPPAVEGVMHAIAELLENATVFSPSRTQVVVTVREVGSGAVVEIDDAGLGMAPDVLDQATARIRDELDLANLGAVPKLGLACVGRWTRELGFGVELSAASAYGGTRAVAFLPYRLLTEPLSHFTQGGTGTSAYGRGPGAREAAGPGGGPGIPAGRAPVAYGAPEAGGGRSARTAHPYGNRPPEARSWGAPDGPAVPSAGPSAGETRAALPRRRSRRGAAVEAAAQQALGPRVPPAERPLHPAPQPPIPPAPAMPERAAGWSPEDARASVANVLSGTRRGRATVAEARERAEAEAWPGDRYRDTGHGDAPHEEAAPAAYEPPYDSDAHHTYSNTTYGTSYDSPYGTPPTDAVSPRADGGAPRPPEPDVHHGGRP
ncbi:ATP-binding protein [Streptomyces sp. NPDC094448]|uniref:ATP-binding protein n=1 Tax=Streptomyces sp. NPDC094448 TaxID=3366063 RepID=UPI0037FAC894